MSEEAPNAEGNGNGRRRRKRGKSRLSWPVIGGIALGTLLLVNLGMGLTGLFGDEGEPTGFVTLDMVRWVGLWLPVTIIVGISLQAIRWTSARSSSSDSEGINWLRWGFLAALLAAGFQLWAMYEQRDSGGYLFEREGFVYVSVIAQAVIVTLFAIAARGQSQRGSSGRRRKRRRPDEGDEWAIGASASSTTRGDEG